jgi:pimeloyl-ACP methyl ester carboxylesterase
VWGGCACTIRADTEKTFRPIELSGFSPHPVRVTAKRHTSVPVPRSADASDEPRSVVVDGVRQVYRVAGEGPVCLVHPGGPGVHPGYLRMPRLETSLTMVYLDPVGSGDSDLLPDGDYSMSRYASFAAACLDDLGVRTAHLLGHSHGGFVALQFALDHAERLESLILYDTAPLRTQELTDAATEEVTRFARRWPDRPEAAAAEQVWQEVNVARTRAVIDDESHRRFLEVFLPAYFADFRRTAAETGTDLTLRITHDPNRRPVHWDVRERLAEIGVPTLVIAGTYDVVCPLRYARVLQEGIPGARWCEFHASGHFAHIEEPDAFDAAVLEFVMTTGTEQPR